LVHAKRQVATGRLLPHEGSDIELMQQKGCAELQLLSLAHASRVTQPHPPGLAAQEVPVVGPVQQMGLVVHVTMGLQ
jgi:hypothetical protein